MRFSTLVFLLALLQAPDVTEDVIKFDEVEVAWRETLALAQRAAQKECDGLEASKTYSALLKEKTDAIQKRHPSGYIIDWAKSELRLKVTAKP